jgi:uncharacterized protein (TIGR02646 family)
MRRIQKSPEPASLAEHRLSSGATYANLPSDTRRELQQRLCQDQGHLCAYCLSRIRAESFGLKIEHFRTQSAHSHKQLQWDNLLGVCYGGTTRKKDDEGQPSAQRVPLYCESLRGDKELRCNPASAGFEPELHFRYLDNGLLQGLSEDARQDLQRLNLNHHRLQQNRKVAVHVAMTRLPKGGEWKVADLQRERERWSRPGSDGRLPEYSQAVLAFLDRQIKRRG